MAKGNGRFSMGSQKGVTLIELAVVIMIMGILAVIGVGYFIGFRSKYRIDTSAKDLVGRLRLIKVLSIAKNTPVSVIFNTIDSTYCSFLDTNLSGTWNLGEEYINLDSGAVVSSYDISAKEMHTDVSMYAVNFNLTSSITVSPPSGLPDVTLFPPGAVNGVVCMQTEVDDDGGNDDFEYRRITVTPVVGRIKLWRGINTATGIDRTNPECNSNDTNWEKQ